MLKSKCQWKEKKNEIISISDWSIFRRLLRENWRNILWKHMSSQSKKNPQWKQPKWIDFSSNSIQLHPKHYWEIFWLCVASEFKKIIFLELCEKCSLDFFFWEIYFSRNIENPEKCKARRTSQNTQGESGGWIGKLEQEWFLKVLWVGKYSAHRNSINSISIGSRMLIARRSIKSYLRQTKKTVSLIT